MRMGVPIVECRFFRGVVAIEHDHAQRQIALQQRVAQMHTRELTVDVNAHIAESLQLLEFGKLPIGQLMPALGVRTEQCGQIGLIGNGIEREVFAVADDIDVAPSPQIAWDFEQRRDMVVIPDIKRPFVL